MRTFAAYVEWDPETKLYVGIIPGVPGAHSQGVTLDELRENLKEVLELCLESCPLPRNRPSMLDS
jgi:predicted RNase H-like HicB family nuclease